MGDEPDYVVLRRHSGLPDDFHIPERILGVWWDRRDIRIKRFNHCDEDGTFSVAVPAGRFEVREYDGAVAEVWEFQP